jgi:dihydroxyacid dehydratase/phosphogluconate dehydratase
MMEDLHNVGGIPALLKYLLNHTDLIDGSQLTVTGKTIAQNLEDVAELDIDNQDIVKRLDNPIKKTGHLTILRGNLAPGTAVAKITGKEGLKFEGTAKCFDECVFSSLAVYLTQSLHEQFILVLHCTRCGRNYRWNGSYFQISRAQGWTWYARGIYMFLLLLYDPPTAWKH